MAPVTVLVVEKSGSIKELPLKNYDESELYKKAGHKSNDGFKVYAQWNIEDLNDKAYSIYVYGKITGRANQENKFEFPPPIDTTLFFGNCLIVNKNEDDEVVSITEEEWETIYDYLYGGFEDLGDEDSEDEEDEDDGLPRTKEGYVKDDFIVDDDEDEDEEEEEEEDRYDDEEEDFRKHPDNHGKEELPIIQLNDQEKEEYIRSIQPGANNSEKKGGSNVSKQSPQLITTSNLVKFLSKTAKQ